MNVTSLPPDYLSVLNQKLRESFERGRIAGARMTFADRPEPQVPGLRAMPLDRDDDDDRLDPEAARYLMQAMVLAAPHSDTVLSEFMHKVGHHTKTLAFSVAWDESRHPRDDHGRFVRGLDIAKARTDPAFAERLRSQVTNPDERAKLDAQINHPSGRTTGLSKTGSKGSQAVADTHAHITQLREKSLKPGGVGIDDLKSLASSLNRHTGDELQELKGKLGLRAGGYLKVEQVNKIIDKAVDHQVNTSRAAVGAPPVATTAIRPDGTPQAPSVEDVHTVPTASLHVDAGRFQYKVSGIGEKGVGAELKGVDKWNPELGGVVTAWRDPETGKDHVVNGHHRHELAERTGQKTMNVRYIQAKDAAMARAKGAVQNIAEGKGTALDAAKYLRDSGSGIDDLKAAGVSLSGRMAADAVALKGMSDQSFGKLARGDLDEQTAVAVAKHLPDDPAKQDAMFKVVADREAQGKAWGTPMIETAAKKMARSGTVTTSGGDLFGDWSDERSTWAEEAELEHHVGQKLKQEANNYAAVASQKRADAVSDAGNVLNVDENAKRRDAAVRTHADFTREAGLVGPVADKLKAHAAELVAARTPQEKADVKQRALESVRTALAGGDPQADAGGAGGGVGGREADGGAGQPAQGAAGAAGAAGGGPAPGPAAGVDGGGRNSVGVTVRPLTGAEPLNEITNAIDPHASPAEKVRQIQKLTAENRPRVDEFLKGLDAKFGTESGSNEKLPDRVLAKAGRPSIRAVKPWHDVEHVRDAFRFKTVLKDARDLPGIIEHLEKNLGARVVKRDVDKFMTPGVWGWRITAFDLQMPNGQLAEYYLPVQEMEHAKNGSNHHLFEKWRNHDWATLTPEQNKELEADLQASRDVYQGAFDAYLSRSGATDSELRAAMSKVAVPAGSTADNSSRSAGLNTTPGTQDLPSRVDAANPASSTNARPSIADAATATVSPPKDTGIVSDSAGSGGVSAGNIPVDPAHAHAYRQAAAHARDGGRTRKKQLVARVAEETGMTPTDAEAALEQQAAAVPPTPEHRKGRLADKFHKLHAADDQVGMHSFIQESLRGDHGADIRDAVGGAIDTHYAGRGKDGNAGKHRLVAAALGGVTAAPPPEPVEDKSPLADTAPPPPEPVADTHVEQMAAKDHTADLEAVKPGSAGVVGGYHVTRNADGSFAHQIGGKKTMKAGTAAEVNAAIQGGWAGQKWQAKRVQDTLDRADKHEPANPFDMGERDRFDAETAKADAMPEGVEGVSLGGATRGRVGSIVTDGTTGRKVLKFDDTPDEYSSSDFEPTDPKHSWRTGDLKVKKKNKAGGRTRGMFDEPAPPAAGPQHADTPAKLPHQQTLDEFAAGQTLGGTEQKTVEQLRTEYQTAAANTPHNADVAKAALDKGEATIRGRHKIAVLLAHSQGQPVPAAVLADHPDLAGKVPAAAAAQPEPTKQPWEMSASELEDHKEKNPDFAKKYEGKYPGNFALAHRQFIQDAIKAGNKVPLSVRKELGIQEPWERTQNEHLTHVKNASRGGIRMFGGESADKTSGLSGDDRKSAIDNHRQHIEKARDAGEPIPPDVQADYPDLFPPAAPPVAADKAAGGSAAPPDAQHPSYSTHPPVGPPQDQRKRLPGRFMRSDEAMDAHRRHAPQVGDVFTDHDGAVMRVNQVDAKPLLVTRDNIDDGVGYGEPGWYTHWQATPVESRWHAEGRRDRDPARPAHILDSPPGINAGGRNAARPKYAQLGHATHKDFVESLYQQGKSVSPESAARYPDLAQKYGPPAATAEAEPAPSEPPAQWKPGVGDEVSYAGPGADPSHKYEFRGYHTGSDGQKLARITTTEPNGIQSENSVPADRVSEKTPEVQGMDGWRGHLFKTREFAKRLIDAGKLDPTAAHAVWGPNDTEKLTGLIDAATGNTPQVGEAMPDPVPTGPQPETAQANPHLSLASHLADRFRNGDQITSKELFAAANQHHGGTRAEGKYGPSDAYDSMESGLNMALMGHSDPRVGLAEAQEQARHLADRVKQLPTQTNRSGNKDSYQQFSTPPHYAFAAAWVANLRPDDHVLEPSAGTGSLAVHAKNAGATVHANELDPRRADLLKPIVGAGNVHTENAEHVSAILPGRGVAPTAVLMNPPFSQTAGRMGNKKELLTGAKHIEEAANLLPDGGRAVAIVGRGMTPDAPTYKDWFAKMEKKGMSLRANVGVEGDEYKKYGTGFGTRLLVFDKAKTDQPPVTGDAADIPDLMAKLEGVRNDRQQTPAVAPDERAGDGVPAAVGGDAAGGPAGPAATGAGVDGGERAGADGGVPPAAGGAAGASGGDAAAGPGGVRPAGGGSREEPVAAAGGTPGQPGGGVAAGRKRGKGGKAAGGQPAGVAGPRVPELRPAAPVGLTPPDSPATTAGGAATGPTAEAPRHTGGEGSLFESYRPSKVRIPGAQKHPASLVESSAMSAVQPPAASYQPHLSPDLVAMKETELLDDNGNSYKTNIGLSEAGLESVVYAGQAHGKFLPAGGGTDLRHQQTAWHPEHGRHTLTQTDPTNPAAPWEMEGEGGAKKTFGSVHELRKHLADNGFNTQKENGEYEAASVGDPAYRRGFFVGDGTGAGKGRQIAGVMTDNWNQGRKKHVWVSKSWPLMQDAHRDWREMGQDPKDLHHFDDLRGKSPPKDGVTFITYGTLKSKSKDPAKPSNLDVLVNHLGADFDGVIAFDEAHAMANATATEGGRGQKEASQQALAGVELQRRLPNARVMYVSATGATEVSNLAYAERLGMWGRGTAFPTKEEFISQMDTAGLSAMESVAQSLKAMGGYTARSLSFDDGTEHGKVTYDRVTHKLEDHQREMYNAAARGWQQVLKHVDKALELTGGKHDKNAKGAARSQFWGSQLRFFNQLMTSVQTPSVIAAMEKDLAEGRSPVVQLVNTMEAATDRQVAKRDPDDPDSLDRIDISPKEMLMNYLEKSFPVHRFQEETDADGNVRMMPVLDSEGNHVTDPEAVAMREKLMDEMEQLHVPESPIDQIVNHFGHEVVAEATGRTNRLILKDHPDGTRKRVLEKRNTALANVAEADAFQAGKKRVMVFSDAGGTGRSYHADKKAGNQAQRVHYMLQPGWRADNAVQGLGRTHRTNQVIAPQYRLVEIDALKSQKRFVSTIARRLDQLGALTKGQRQAGSSGLFSAADNLESKEAREALDRLFNDVRRNKVPGLDPKELMQQMGFADDEDEKKVGRRGRPKELETPPMSQFLNRMLSLEVHMQDKVFGAFDERLQQVVEAAVTNGTLDQGMENFKADHVEKVSETPVYKDADSGAEAKMLKVTARHKAERVPFIDTQKGDNKPSFYVRNKRSGRVYAVSSFGTHTDAKNGRVYDRVVLRGPQWRQNQQFEPASHVTGGPYDDRFEKLDETQARELWDKEFADIPEFHETEEHFLTGAILPIWDRIPGEQAKVYRVKPAGGEAVVGRHIPADKVQTMMRNLGVKMSGGDTSAPTVHGKLSAGTHAAELANGWKLMPVRVGGEKRIEIMAGNLYAASAELQRDGVKKERVGYDHRYFVPTGPDGAKVLERITASRPIVEVAPFARGKDA